MSGSPKSILMIKSHSAGVGDLLRSSAAWRVLKNRFPQAKLHLLFLSKHPGYASEGLMGEHHLLDSCTFLTLREKSPDVKGVSKTPFKRLLSQALELAQLKEVDCVIDFEMHGLRSSLLTWCLVKGMNKKMPSIPVSSVGVGQFPMRSWFYDQASVGLEAFAKARNKSLPMDYTDRDFVALSALELERNAVPIELRVEPSAKQKVEFLLQSFQAERAMDQGIPRPVLGVNIGCGTPDALYKRPDLNHFVDALVAFLERNPHDIVLTGAPFEQAVNLEFAMLLSKRWAQAAPGLPEPLVWDGAGKTSMPELSALISACQLFVSTDSGPYHMAVALRVPTFCWFVVNEPSSLHREPWCAASLNPSVQEFVTQTERLVHPNPF